MALTGSQNSGTTRRLVLPLLVVSSAAALWLALPFQPMSEGMMRDWFDQSVLLSAFEHLLDPSVQASGSGTGPGYLAMASLIHVVTASTPAESLVLLSRLSLFAGFLVVLTAGFGRHEGRWEVSYPALAAATVLSLLTPTAFFSGYPWTHMPATFLGLATVAAVRLAGPRPWLGAFAAGAALALLLQTRNFEAQVLLACIAVVVAVTLAASWRRIAWATWWRRAAGAVAGGAVAWAATALLTGQWSPYQQYLSTLSSADRSLTVASVLVSAPQVFVDPCAGSICALSDYSPASLSLVPMTTDAWRAPLINQLPALAVATVGAWALLLVCLRTGRRIPSDTWISLLASAALALAYCANPVMGGAHLKYGVARDFLLPAMLTVWALARLLYVLHRGNGLSTRAAGATAALLCCLTAAVAVAPLPRLEGTYVQEFTVAPASCSSWPCDVEVSVVAPAGSTAPAAGELIIVAFCDDVPVSRLDEGDRPPACAGQTSVGLMPRSLGTWMTPEGDQLLLAHRVLIG